MKSKDMNNGRNPPLETIFPDIPKRFPQLQIQPDLIIPWPRKTNGMAGRYGVAIIPPTTKNNTP
jgi:hypothetical protein